MQDTESGIAPELVQKAQALAIESECSAGDIINRALRYGLESWEKEFRLIQSAAQEADRGDFASDDDIERVRNKYRPVL